MLRNLSTDEVLASTTESIGRQTIWTGFWARFKRPFIVGLLSVALLIPSLWQSHIQSVDLPSHLYNAWLRSEIVAAHLSGLAVVHQRTNIVADQILYFALGKWGPAWAERCLIGCSVLIFFWGAFRFVSTISLCRIWHITPLLAIVTYGVVFRWGFSNFYLSFGLCLWAASLSWSRRRFKWLLILALSILAFSAHVMPPIWLAVIVAYIHIVQNLKRAWRIWIFAAGAAALVAVHFALPLAVLCSWPTFTAAHLRLYIGLIGLGQLPNGKYIVVGLIVLVVWALWLRQIEHRYSWRSLLQDPIAQLVLLDMMASMLLPESVTTHTYRAPFNMIGIRLSLMNALLVPALLVRATEFRWQTIAIVCAALLFFSFAYVDDRATNTAYERLQTLIDTLPRGARVVMTVRDDPTRIPKLAHLLDRACIGRCFDYANYEPSTGQFLVQANRPNPYVMSDLTATEHFERGTYIVKSEDLPLYRVHLCNPAESSFCAALTAVGQTLTWDDVAIRSGVSALLR